MSWLDTFILTKDAKTTKYPDVQNKSGHAGTEIRLSSPLSNSLTKLTLLNWPKTGGGGCEEGHNLNYRHLHKITQKCNNQNQITVDYPICWATERNLLETSHKAGGNLWKMKEAKEWRINNPLLQKSVSRVISCLDTYFFPVMETPSTDANFSLGKCSFLFSILYMQCLKIFSITFCRQCEEKRKGHGCAGYFSIAYNSEQSGPWVAYLGSGV